MCPQLPKFRTRLHLVLIDYPVSCGPHEPFDLAFNNGLSKSADRREENGADLLEGIVRENAYLDW